MINNKPEATERPLVLGDYVTVHVLVKESGEVDSLEPSDLRVHREVLFQRIRKQRGEIFQRLQKQKGKLIDPRRHDAA